MGLPFDPSLPEVRADPYPTYREMREHDPVHWSEPSGFWFLTRYDDCVTALKDSRLSSARTRLAGHAAARDASMFDRTMRAFMVFTDPPDHTRLRVLVAKALTPQAVEGRRPRIRSLVASLLERVHGAGRMDVIADLAYPLPAIVVSEMLGAPAEDRGLFKTWSSHIAAAMDGTMGGPDVRARAEYSVLEMSAYFRELVSARRGDPRGDLLSALIAARDSEDALSEEEVVANSLGLVFAGHETTTNLIGNGLVALLRDPGQLERLRVDPALVPTAVEEFLRYDSPAQLIARVATTDVEMRGRTIRRGQRVQVVLGAANRDPAQFPRAEQLDVGRHDNRHIAFAYGLHFCLGAQLARIEAQCAFEALIRLGGLRPAAGALEWLPTLSLRGLVALPVAFDP